MEIQEYQAKEFFKKYGIKVPDGIAVTKKDDIADAARKIFEKSKSKKVVVKAQVLAGGRGKAGGVKLANSLSESIDFANQIWGMKIVTPQTGEEGKIVHRIYFEEASDIVKEFYASLIVNRERKCISFVVSTEGGMDIEEVAKNDPSKIVTIDIDIINGLSDSDIKKICLDGLKIKESDQLFDQIDRLMHSLYRMFIECDCSQIEINPLCIVKDNDSETIVALDAKVSFDDNAMFRHKDFPALRSIEEEGDSEVKAREHGLSYVQMNGNIGCMVNGAGLAMATMDIINHYGAEPANFLDVGGGTDSEKVKEAFKIILSSKSVSGILVNIFGGIVRCDDIANGIVKAAKDINIKVPIVVRLMGTNHEKGKEILNSSKLKISGEDDLAKAAKKIVELINS